MPTDQWISTTAVSAGVPSYWSAVVRGRRRPPNQTMASPAFSRHGRVNTVQREVEKEQRARKGVEGKEGEGEARESPDAARRRQERKSCEEANQSTDFAA